MANRDENQAPLYENGFFTQDEYELDPGVCILPIAVDPPTTQQELVDFSPVVILRLHAPYRIRKSVNRASKQNSPPIIASPSDTGAFVFLGGTLTVENTLNQNMMTFDWDVLSEFYFVENCVSRIEDGFILGTPPFTYTSQLDNALSSGGGSNPPQIGAIAYANLDAIIGYNSGNLINLSGSWVYNTPSFLPGIFFSTDNVNGGDETIQYAISASQ